MNASSSSISLTEFEYRYDFVVELPTAFLSFTFKGDHHLGGMLMLEGLMLRFLAL